MLQIKKVIDTTGLKLHKQYSVKDKSTNHKMVLQLEQLSEAEVVFGNDNVRVAINPDNVERFEVKEYIPNPPLKTSCFYSFTTPNKRINELGQILYIGPTSVEIYSLITKNKQVISLVEDGLTIEEFVLVPLKQQKADSEVRSKKNKEVREQQEAQRANSNQKKEDVVDNSKDVSPFSHLLDHLFEMSKRECESLQQRGEFTKPSEFLENLRKECFSKDEKEPVLQFPFAEQFTKCFQPDLEFEEDEYEEDGQPKFLIFGNPHELSKENIQKLKEFSKHMTRR